MKLIVAALFLVSVMAKAGNTPAENWTALDNGLGIQNVVEEVPTPDDIVRILTELQFGSGRSLPGTIVAVEKIINLGEKVWKIVEANKPVINVKTTYANAVPYGVRSTEELQNFSPVHFRSYHMNGKNWLGMTVYDLTYTIVHRFGGDYEGTGKYLDAVTVLPHKLNVSWGYKVNFGVDHVSTTNVGTREKPVGSILMDLNFNVSSVLKASHFRNIYEFRGDTEEVRSISKP